MNALKLLSFHEEIHERAVLASKNYHRTVGELLSALERVEHESVFLKYGCTSLFSYAIRFLNLSESIAFQFISVLRKSKEVPALRTQVESGELDLSKAKKIISVITPENQESWIEKAKTLPTRALERAVASQNPDRVLIQESTQYVSKDRLKLTLGISDKAFIKLKRMQDLVSGSKRKGVSLEETLEEAIELYLKHKDPVERAKRNYKEVIEKSNSKTSNELTQTTIHRLPIPAHVKHEVHQRDEGRCQYRGPSGNKCGSTRWVDLHHVKPVHNGGANTEDNLITLCKAHHRSIQPKL